MQILQSVKPSQPKALILVRLRGIREIVLQYHDQSLNYVLYFSNVQDLGQLREHL